MFFQILPILATNFHVNILAQPILINPSLFQKFNAEENLVCNKYDGTYIYFNCRWITYNILIAFAIHLYESAIGKHVSPPCWIPSHHPSHPISPGFIDHLRHTSNLHCLSILYMVMYVFHCYMLKSSDFLPFQSLFLKKFTLRQWPVETGEAEFRLALWGNYCT